MSTVNANQLLREEQSRPGAEAEVTQTVYVILDSAESINLVRVESGIVADIEVESLLPSDSDTFYQIKSQPISNRYLNQNNLYLMNPDLWALLSVTHSSGAASSLSSSLPSAMSSRVLLRQDLMRQQTLEQQQKELQKQKASAQNSEPIQVSLSSGSVAPAQVPLEILKVQTGLENPTRYHIQQAQRQQVKQYLSTAQGRAVSHDGAKMQTDPSPKRDFSPVPLSPKQEMEEAVLEDIISLESSLNDEYLSLFDPELQIATTLHAVCWSRQGQFVEEIEDLYKG
ncbi:hypothetical protein WMY93_027705 [Mugilogobius chulae]|uniref:MiT/TFE transcription factors N-terminal domain-containing protein n=1 Tax=Mugilogobius chulae TaxID=88201 RepID=A0AAW0MZI2_9GOBI